MGLLPLGHWLEEHMSGRLLPYRSSVSGTYISGSYIMFSPGTYVERIITQGTYVWRACPGFYMWDFGLGKLMSGGLMTGWL